MADGTTRPIEEVEPGDQVLADDPLDDLPAQVQTVVGRSSSTTRTWTTVEVDEDGDGIADGEITSTPNHLIWTENGIWEEAVELEVGDLLLSDDGSWVEVTSIQSNTVEEETTFDLDVEDIDSFFIIASDGSILVHNCNAGGPGQWKRVARRDGRALEHQSRKSGKPIIRKDGKAYIEEYEVGGVRFDDYKNGNLVDYKDDYSNFIDPKTNVFRPWFKGKAEARKEALRQIGVANGNPVVWEVGPDQLDAFLDAVGNIPGITVIP